MQRPGIHRSASRLLIAVTSCLSTVPAAAFALIPPYIISAPSGSNNVTVFSGNTGGGAVIVGYYNYNLGNPSGAFRWTSTNGFTTFPPLAGQSPTYAVGISDNSFVSVGNSGDRGVRWTSGGPTVSIGPFPGGSPTTVNGVSGDGITVHGQTRQLSGTMQAFSWTQAGGLNLLPMLSGGSASFTRATTMNGTRIVGYTFNPSIGNLATVWSGGVATDISFGSAALPVAISQNGSTIWGAGDVNPLLQHAFRWQLIGSNYVLDDAGIMPGYNKITLRGALLDGTAHVGDVRNSSTGAAASYLWTNDTGWHEIGAWLTSMGWDVSALSFMDVTGVVPGGLYGAILFGNGERPDGQRVAWWAGSSCLHKPTIYTDPSEQFGVCVGTDVSFSAAFTGTYIGDPSYQITAQWFKDGVPINNGPTGNGSGYSGVTSPNLVIANAQLADAGFYSCTFTNTCGSSSTSSAELTMQALPQLTSLPAPGYVCPNASASFTVGAIFASSYQWQYYSQTFGVWVDFPNGSFIDPTTNTSMTASGATGPTLSLSNISLGEVAQLQIRCIVANSCRSLRPVYTTLEPISAPTFAAQPNNVYNCFGTPAAFNVSAPGATGWYWQIYDPFLNMWLYLNDGLFIDGTTFMYAIVSGAYTQHLSFDITQFGTVGNTLQFRAIAGNLCGSVVSNVGTLTICRADFNCDGFVDFTDFDAFAGAFDVGGPGADFNGDGFLDFTDFDEYVSAFELGC